MLDKRFKQEYECWHTEDGKSVNSIINYIMVYDYPMYEYHEELGKEVLIILNRGIELTGELLDKMGLIRLGNMPSAYIPDGYPEYTDDNRINIKCAMTDDEVNVLINKQF